MFCAGRTGQLLNLSSLAADCGITHNTAKAWLSVLEASYLVYRLQPHHASFNKRLVKAPKLYFYDVGLACWLLGIQSPQQLEAHPLRGALFETWVIAELIKFRLYAGERPGLFFWRDSNGNEVDVLVEQAAQLMPVEIKSGATVAPDFFAGLEKWLALAGDLGVDPLLIYGGGYSYRHKGIRVVGWRDIDFSVGPRGEAPADLP
jgi:predicted AAA+ superfamily ATPase